MNLSSWNNKFLTSKSSEQSISLMKRLLCVEPEDRYTPLQCLNHPWISSENIEPLTLNENISFFKKLQKLF